MTGTIGKRNSELMFGSFVDLVYHRFLARSYISLLMRY